jgi:hypothetical protein
VGGDSRATRDHTAGLAAMMLAQTKRAKLKIWTPIR